MGLVVISEEENGKTLLVHQISREDIYTRSETTIITWHDAEISTDVAISFQEQVGCEHIWQQINQVQGEERLRQQDHEARNRKANSDEYEQPTTSGAHMGNGDFMDNDMELPAPELRNLENIAKVLSHVPPFHRDRIASQLMKPNYLAGLLDLFKQCEDLENTEGLTHMYAIVRSAIMLNDSSVLEEMLKEEHVMDVLGALEYDPDVKQPQKHREFLQSHVQFKEVVPITNAQILAKIHQTYRIQYLKDVILPRSLDDATYATLSSLALFNNMEVVGALMADGAFLPQLFQRLQSADPADPQWHDLVAFLQEFCSLARHLQQQQRASLFNRLVQLGLFEVVTRIIEHSVDDVKLKATDILMSSMQHDVTALREFLYKQAGHTLFGLLVRELTDSTDAGLAEQVCEALKLLMDPDTMEAPVEKNELLDVFYDKYLDKMTEVILSDQSINSTGTRSVPAATLGLILELMCFCVQNHSYRIRYYTLRKHLVEKVLKLLHRRERWLVCGTVRFMRVCVALKDEFFIRYLLRHNCFGPLMVVFFENGERYNLLNSAVLDLIDFIRKENIKPLLDHLVEQYGHRFDELNYVKTFEQLKLKYDQAPERAGNGGTEAAQGAAADGAPDAAAAAAAAGGAAAGIRGRTIVFNSAGPHRAGMAPYHRRRRRDDRDMDKDEEDYFSEDADDEADGREDGGQRHHHHAGAAAVGGGQDGGDAEVAAPKIDSNSRDHGSRALRGGPGRVPVVPESEGTGGGAGGGDEGKPATALEPGAAASAADAAGADAQAGGNRQWPGLVDYEDDESEHHAQPQEASQRQEPQQRPEEAPGVSAPEEASRAGQAGGEEGAVPNGPTTHASAGRGPSLDLGRRPRSPQSDAAAAEEGAGGTPGKRMRSEDGGPAASPAAGSANS
ncbi:hypothetical protein HYH02_004675 [Chlamydomonas schloesseri]|uniref:Serine/threonine-protein phosphatase 4 regulatory subunit 3-like central domain-containing protein n=1 Tax=Chlamydomonas schloesseri TaxID=2026947 RepID=A0A835WPY8_9CHLO|nr:hypothetical protein HYH02_004675 [Chlamydomonas schloesseri]|eukprot:KAG2450841.1 hypothetical protein HYH02_004675 [Chlamydomonas schloesseri]